MAKKEITHVMTWCDVIAYGSHGDCDPRWLVYAKREIKIWDAGNDQLALYRGLGIVKKVYELAVGRKVRVCDPKVRPYLQVSAAAKSAA